MAKTTKSPSTPSMPQLPTVLHVPLALEDVNLQRGMFADYAPGRYVLQYTSGSQHMPIVQCVPVYWDGENVIA